MKSRHRIPSDAYELEPDPISERYQIEVDMSTQRLERRYRRAQKALEAAEKRAAKARPANPRDRKAHRKHADLCALVEERRRELREIELLMMPTDYAGRDSRRRSVRHETGAVTIPLGATTGQRTPQKPTPTFPVTYDTR